jgi:hypothetical protein
MSGVRGHDDRGAAVETAAVPARPRAVSAPASERAAFARALQAAQRRGSDCGRGAPSDRTDAAEALRSAGDGANVTCAGAGGMSSSAQTRPATPGMRPAPSAGARAARPVARAAARQGLPQKDAAQDSPTTIEWRCAALPSGRLTLSRAEGGAWTLRCQAADLDVLRGAVARLAERFEQCGLGPLQVRVD